LAAILVPSRELAQQIINVLRPLAVKFNYNVVRLVGGGGTKNAATDKPFKKQW
jgi:superfamily II DNA/RNA helicase